MRGNLVIDELDNMKDKQSFTHRDHPNRAGAKSQHQAFRSRRNTMGIREQRSMDRVLNGETGLTSTKYDSSEELMRPGSSVEDKSDNLNIHIEGLDDQNDSGNEDASSMKPMNLQSKLNKSRIAMNSRIRARQRNSSCLKSPSSVDIPVFNEAFKVTGMKKNSVQKTLQKRSVANKTKFSNSSSHIPAE